jgi:pimeloyl-ACP methyl ester carboxylesterase
MTTPKVSEGTIPFEYEGETLQTWYKVVGDVAPRNPRPLVVLHGGPGVSHDYMIPVSDIVSFSSHRPVIFYDQVGNGRSTHLQQKDILFCSSLMN